MFRDELQEFEDDPYPARYDMLGLYARTGVIPRNVYFYVQMGLIPKAIGSGLAARYTYEHVVRLIVLVELKKRGMTLREIGVFLSGSTLGQLHRIANGRDPRETIQNVRRLLYRPPGSPPPGAGQLTRIEIADGVELFVGEAFLPRAAVRLKELTGAIADVLDVPPPEIG